MGPNSCERVRTDMSIDDDELILLANTVVDDTPSTAGSILDVITKTLVSAAVSFGIGAAVTGLVTDAADRRRAPSAEEFQSLLFEAVDQEPD
jgi:hypothetical protein